MATIEQEAKLRSENPADKMEEIFETQVGIVRGLLNQKKVFDHPSPFPNVNVATKVIIENLEDRYYVPSRGVPMALSIDSRGNWELWRDGEKQRSVSGEFGEIVMTYGFNFDQEIIDKVLNISKDPVYEDEEGRMARRILDGNRGRLEIELVMSLEDARENLRSLTPVVVNI